MSYDFSKAANSLEEYWMPFTQQRQFKKSPRIVVSAEGMYYKDQEGKEVLDCAAGLWCVNAGHNNQVIKDAVKDQLDLLDYAPSFNIGHPTAFRAASRLVAAMPEHISHVFFSNSGSEAVDTALKIALAYHRANGEGTRRVLIGRERAYHGVGFGGISVGGIPYVCKTFGQLLPNVDHLPHTFDLEHNAFSRGQPEWGAHLADDLERLILLHDPCNVAAVIVEPLSGSTGVLPPPKGYLERLREISSKYGVLMIMDEVITGFGRTGYLTTGEMLGIAPDIICTAKALTNGTVPMGATFVAKYIHDTFMKGPEEEIELFHGYTYSGHPLAAAAAIAALDVYRDEKIFENARAMAKPFEDAAHTLREKSLVIDVRNMGIVAAIQLEPHKDGGDYAFEAFTKLFERGLMLRPTSLDTLALSPPLILNENHIDQMFTTIGEVLDELAA